MGSFSIWHWLIVLMVVLLLFGGRGKITQLMGDFGAGLKSFKKSIRDDESFDDREARVADPRALPRETLGSPDGSPERAAEREPATRP